MMWHATARRDEESRASCPRRTAAALDVRASLAVAAPIRCHLLSAEAAAVSFWRGRAWLGSQAASHGASAVAAAAAAAAVATGYSRG